MALSPEEQKIVEFGKANGKSPAEVKAAISKFRSQATSTPAATTSPTPTVPTDPNSARADLSRGFQGAQDALQRGVDREAAQGQEGRGFLGRQFGRFTNGLRTAGEMLGSVGEGVFRALPGGTTVSDTIAAGVGAAASTDTAQSLASRVKGAVSALPDPLERTVKDVAGGAMGALQIGGAVTTGGAIANTPFKTVSAALKAAPEMKVSIPTPRVGELINKYRAQLSQIDPRYDTVLRQQRDPNKVMAYFDQAEKAAVDPAAPMATKLASDRAVDAYKAIDAGMSEAGKLKAELLDGIGTQKVPGNIPGRSIDSVNQTITERFGIVIDDKGKVSQAAGRMANVDDKSQKLIAKYVGMLRELGPSPTARQLDDFVDAAQRMLYKQSSPNLFEVADEPVIAFLKQQTGNINNELKQSVDSMLTASGKPAQYGQLNDTYSRLITLSNDLNKRLGIEGDKGASLMKSLFSPQTGEPTRRLFEQIKAETGIDLFEEATLAKFVMESVGDPRSKSLLQQLDALAGDVSAVNLMEPGSWLNYIREKADLDGRDLAEEIIRQTTAAGNQK